VVVVKRWKRLKETRQGRKTRPARRISDYARDRVFSSLSRPLKRIAKRDPQLQKMKTQKQTIQDTKEILSDKEAQPSFGLLVAEHISSHATQVTTSVEVRAGHVSPTFESSVCSETYLRKLTTSDL
jgi:hypothetical protein